MASSGIRTGAFFAFCLGLSFGSALGHPTSSATKVSTPPAGTALEIFLTSTLSISEPQNFIISQRFASEIFPSPDKRTDEEYLEQIRRQFFSEISYPYIAKIVSYLGLIQYPNAIVVGPQGIGKTILLNQIMLLYAFGIFPKELGEKLNILEPDSPARQNIEGLLIRTRFVLVNSDLLRHEVKSKASAIPSESMRVQEVMTRLFEAAEKDFKASGLRTVFVLEEARKIPKSALDTLLQLLDPSGYLPNREKASMSMRDSGYHVLAMTTDGGYHEMMKHDDGLERRFNRLDIGEPSRRELFAAMKKDVVVWEGMKGILIEDDVIDYMISMKLFLDWPPIAAPAAVKKGLMKLIEWKLQNTGMDPRIIDLSDARRFLIELANLPPAWAGGPNGEEPFFDLADRVKEMVTGHEVVIEQIALKLRSWINFGIGTRIPIFVLVGPSGSGKDTIMRAFNEVLFGSQTSVIEKSLAGVSGHAVDAILSGPPLGNHSDGARSFLHAGLDRNHGVGIIGFNEVADFPSEGFDPFKVVVEAGEITPQGEDSRKRPLRASPIFFLGQYGEGDEEAENMNYDDLIEALSRGKLSDNGASLGAFPKALLARIEATGGIFMIPRLKPSQYPKIVKQKIDALKDKFKLHNRTELNVDSSVHQLILSLIDQQENAPRRIVGLVSALIENGLTMVAGKAFVVKGSKVGVRWADEHIVFSVDHPRFAEKSVPIAQLIPQGGRSCGRDAFESGT